MRSFVTKLNHTVASLLVIAVVTAAVYAPIPQTNNVPQAHALAVAVVGGNGTIQETISAGANTLIAGFQDAFFIKEFTLDGIANGLAKMILKSMTQSILNWINSGFQGKPAFVTDLKQFMRDRIDQTVGEYIYNDPALNFLCSPFQLDVKIALATSYQQSAHDGFGSKAQCTLSQVTDNVEGFLNGSFSEGGWNSWFELTQNPVNTPTGAYLAAESEMYARIIDEQGNTIKELDWGDGFLSFKVCGDTQNQKNCDITTPGRVIADQINKSLGAGQDALISADEINEIISALFAQLAQMALTGIGGLTGLSQSSNGNPSYLDQLKNEDETSSGIINPFAKAIAREQENTTLQNQIIALVDGAEAKLDAAITAEGSCINLRMPNALIQRRDQARLRVISNSQNVITLTGMNTTFMATSTTAQAKFDLVQDLTQKQQDGTFTGLTENTLLKVDVTYTFKDTVTTFETQIAAAVNRCDRDNDN